MAGVLAPWRLAFLWLRRSPRQAWVGVRRVARTSTGNHPDPTHLTQPSTCLSLPNPFFRLLPVPCAQCHGPPHACNTRARASSLVREGSSGGGRLRGVAAVAGAGAPGLVPGVMGVPPHGISRRSGRVAGQGAGRGLGAGPERRGASGSVREELSRSRSSGSGGWVEAGSTCPRMHAWRCDRGACVLAATPCVGLLRGVEALCGLRAEGVVMRVRGGAGSACCVLTEQRAPRCPRCRVACS